MSDLPGRSAVVNNAGGAAQVATLVRDRRQQETA